MSRPMSSAQAAKRLQKEIDKLTAKLVALQAPKPRKTRIVTNLMSGRLVRIDADTPLCCDPSSETYWSM